MIDRPTDEHVRIAFPPQPRVPDSLGRLVVLPRREEEEVGADAALDLRRCEDE